MSQLIINKIKKCPYWELLYRGRDLSSFSRLEAAGEVLAKDGFRAAQDLADAKSGISAPLARGTRGDGGPRLQDGTSEQA